MTARLSKSADIRAIDYSPNAIRIAKQKTNGKVKFYLMDFYKKQPEGKADKVVACRSMYHPNLLRGLEILSEHTAEGGLAIIAHPHEKLKII